MTTIDCTASTSGCDRGEAAELRLVGDVTRRIYRLCAGCRVVYEAAPFAMSFIPAAAPEWVERAVAKRLPARSYAAQVI